jgi:chromosome partitioning protein
MRIIAFASQKGGSGKTTLAGHIAVQAERAGAGPVAIIDTDPQGSLSDWWNARQSETPVFAQTFISRLGEDLQKMRDLGVELVIFDTPPAITATIEQVIRVCDLVVIPTRPSPHDLRAAGATVDLVENVGKPLVFVVNGATPRARITAEAAIALSQHGTVAPITIHHRTEFAASMIDGRTVMELACNPRSSEEIAQLWDYLADRLARTARPALAPAASVGVAARPGPAVYAGPRSESA